MLATMQPNSVASVSLRAVRVDDSRPGKRKRCPPSNNERMDGKRVKVVYTATVPLKRWKLPRRPSGHNGVFVLKTMAPSSNKPLCRAVCDRLTGNNYEHDVESSLPTLNSSTDVNKLQIQKTSDDIGDTSYKIENLSREKALAAQHGSSVLRTTTEARSQTTRTGTKLADSPMSEVSTGETTKDCLEKAMLLNGIVSTDCSSQQHVDGSGCSYTMISSPPYVNEKNTERSLQNTSTKQRHLAHTINHAMSSKDKHIQKTEEAVKHNGTGSDVESLEDCNGGCEEITNLVGDLFYHDKNLTREKDDVLSVPASSSTGPDRQDNVPPENNIRNPNIEVNDDKARSESQNSGAAQTTADDIQACSPETDSDGKQKCDSGKNEPYGVTVKTISTRDLLKVLGQFNLTLKAVPMDRNLAENINSGSAKLQTFVADANGQHVLKVLSSAARDDVKTRIRAAIPLDSCALNNLKAKMQHSETIANRNNGFRKTPNGTFSNWRIKRPRFVQSSNTAERRHFHAGSRTKTANSGHVKRAETLKRREHRRFEQFRELQRRKNNGSKVSGAPHSQSTLQMIPLAKAFHDLEARDKAMQETIETSNKCQTELTLKTTSEEHFCPLSRAMESQTRDRSELSTDPMLTSVAFGNSESDSEDFANNDLVLFQNQIPQLKFPTTCDRSGLNETPNMLSELQEKNMSGGKSLDKTMARKNQLDDSADDDTKVPIGCSFLASDPHRSISNSSTQEMLYGKHKKTLSNRAIVVSSNGKTHSAESDLKIRKRTLSSSTSCDCSSDEYVTGDEFPCESTQIVTWDSKDNLDNSQLYKLKRKPVQDWNAKEVQHWLRRTIRQFERVKTSSVWNLELDGPSSPNADIHHLNLCGTLFSRVTDGAALCRLTSDKLHAFCGDESLSLYLYQRLKELVSERKTKETAMYRDGYCAVSVPPTIPVTSAEQLEESVNIDDLLGSDAIFGSLELTEVLDSQAGSYLKSLGPEDEMRFPTQPTYISDKTLPALFNHFSPATRIPPYQSTSFEQRQAYHRILSPSSVNEYRAHCIHSSPDDTVSPFGRCHSFDVPNIECAYFAESVPSTPTLARSVSPSTFYNLPTVTESQPELVKDRKEKIQGTHPSTSGCSRDGAVSDSDSGIHSPDSTPNKHVIGASTAVKNVPDYPTDSFPVPKYYQDSPTHEFCDTWSKQGVSMEVFSMPIEAATERRNSSKDDSSEDIWERTSTSSTVSALSIESETKLLNMDDCKTYTTKESSLAQQHGKRRQRENGMNIELHSPGEDFVLTSLSETSAHGGFPIYAPHSKCPKMANKGCTTTVYPAFVTQICRSNSASQASNSVPHVDVTMGSFHRKYSESNGSDQMLMSNMNTGSLPTKRGKIGADGPTPFRVAERRHTFNAPETSYIHPYELKIRRTAGKSVHLWEFIRDTLLDPQYCPRLIKWEDRKAGIFRFVQSDVVAGMWGEKKNNPKMTYEKLSRAMRYYYNRGILERVDGRRLVYKFGRNAHGWQPFGETNDSDSGKQTGVAGVKQEMSTNSVFPQRRPRSNTKRKPTACRIAVSVTDDIVPFVKKRRRQISESLPNYVSVVTSQQSSTDTTKPPGLDEKIAAVQKSLNLSNIKVEPQEFHHPVPTVSNTTPATSAPASCIVYVARPERLTSETPTEKEVNVFETEALPLSPAEQYSDRPSKLPSADVLLGKQFRIAAATV